MGVVSIKGILLGDRLGASSGEDCSGGSARCPS